MQALASGMEAGLAGLDAAKLKRDEKRSRLQAAEEDTVLAEIKARQEAQDRSVSIYNAAIAAGKTESEARDMAIKNAVTVKTLPQQLRLADLEVETAEATLANKRADTFRTLNPVRSGGGGGGGREPNPPSATSVLEETGKAVREIGEAREKAATAFEAYRKETDPTKKQRLKEAHGRLAENYRRIRDRLAVLEGRQPGSPFRRSVTGEIYTGPQRPSTGPRPAAAAAKSPKPKSFTGTQAVWDVMTPAEKKLFQ
jgi:hypothetical protein